MQHEQKRPIWIWVITLYFVISIPLTIFTFYSAISGTVALSPAQAAYFSSMTKLDYLVTAVIFVCMICGAINLFLLRKIALVFFIASLICNLGLTFWQLLTGRLSGLIGTGVLGLAGVIVGLILVLAITLYTARLARTNRLT